jgi:hypothetical protein
MRSPFMVHHLDSFILSIARLISLRYWAIHGTIAKRSDDREQAKVECAARAPRARGRAR